MPCSNCPSRRAEGVQHHDAEAKLAVNLAAQAARQVGERSEGLDRLLGPRQQRLVGRLQHRVAGEADDRRMDLLVDLKIVAQLAAAVMPLDLVLQRFEPFEIGLLHPQRRELGGAALDAADGLEQFGQLGAAERRDHGAVVEPELDQALVRQLLQRFAQRGARNAERVGQISLAQRLSRRQLAAHDHEIGRAHV